MRTIFYAAAAMLAFLAEPAAAISISLEEQKEKCDEWPSISDRQKAIAKNESRDREAGEEQVGPEYFFKQRCGAKAKPAKKRTCDGVPDIGDRRDALAMNHGRAIGAHQVGAEEMYALRCGSKGMKK